jgi:hypothetical protein
MIKKSASRKRPAEEETVEIEDEAEGEGQVPIEKQPGKPPKKKQTSRQRLEKALKPKPTETEGRQVNPGFIRNTGDLMDLERKDPGKV